MTKRKRFGVSQALTRGLSETINVVENNAGIFRNAVVPLSRIELDPDNPRKLAISLEDIRQGLDKNDPLYDQKSNELERLNELAFTIESSGVINPVVVYKRGEFYRVVAGERRCLASILAGKNEIDARIFNEKPKGFELKLIQWIENTAREDLTLEERIGNIREIIHEYQLIHDNVPVTATLIKNLIGFSLPQASYYMAVLNAPDDVRSMIAKGQLRSLDKAAIISAIESDDLRQEALTACIEGSSLKELRKIIARERQQNTKPLPLIQKKRGRAPVKVNLGFTLHTSVVYNIVQSVLNRAEYGKYRDVFSKVEWAELDQSTRAFKKLIEIMEREV